MKNSKIFFVKFDFKKASLDIKRVPAFNMSINSVSNLQSEKKDLEKKNLRSSKNTNLVRLSNDLTTDTG